MNIGINLTDPRIDRAFRNTLIGTATVCLFWSGIVAAQTSAARSQLSTKKTQLEAKKNELQTQDIAYRTRRRTAREIGDVPKAVPFQGTSAFAYTTDTLARGAGASLLNIKFGNTSGNNAQSPTFESDVAGGFSSLVKVLDGIATAGSGTVITSTSISRENVNPQTGNAVAKMRIEGNLGQ
jgi:hypothetical protein